MNHDHLILGVAAALGTIWLTTVALVTLAEWRWRRRNPPPPCLQRHGVVDMTRWERGR